MKEKFTAFNFYSIKGLLANEIRISVDLYLDRLGVAHQSQEKQCNFTIENIPLRPVVNDTGIFYVSAIAHKLAAVSQQSADLIATQLASLISCKVVSQPLTIQVLPSGFVYFHLSDKAIAAWLQHLLEADEQGVRTATTTDDHTHVTSQSKVIPNIFKAQYVYARCCSLLRLGQREGLIKLIEQPIWQIIEPQTIPWMDNQGQFYLVNSAERILIAELFSLLDQLSDSSQPNWLKLVDAFENFYSNCRIFGYIKLQTYQLAQARLGLIFVLRLVLKLLLNHRLGVLAPEEL